MEKDILLKKITREFNYHINLDINGTKIKNAYLKICY